MKHTTRTLKYYLGRDVYVKHFNSGEYTVVYDGTNWGDKSRVDIPEGKYNIIGIKLNEVILNYKGTEEISSFDFEIYPILKTVDDMSNEDHLNVYLTEIRYIDMYFCSDNGLKGDASEEYEVTIEELVKLLDNGCGAIPSDQSSTGYLDLFGMPCVTPTMVEEGVKL